MTDIKQQNGDAALPKDAQALPTTRETKIDAEAATWVCPEFSVARIFSSHMVLQREKNIPVWGFSRDPGTQVFATLGGETVTTAVDDENRWHVEFSPRTASHTPLTLTVTDALGHMVTMDDILIGDVWLIGGQSNAELNLSRCMEETPDLVFSEEDGVRLFSQRSGYPRQHPEMLVAPQPDIVNETWHWERASREASLSHSALGWYFAHELIRHVDIPQGLIMMCSGGASIFDLAPAEYAHERGVFAGGMTCEGGLFNTLIHPLLGLSFAGQVFFQGESEGCSKIRSHNYADLLRDYVADERERFGFGFPFYNVQLCSYRDAGAEFFKYLHVVRMKQFEALSSIPRYTLTPCYDLGAPEKYEDWAHSTLKAELGRRLAVTVLADYYGIGDRTEACGPMPVAAVSCENTVKVTFVGVGEGLVRYGETPDESIGEDLQGFFVTDGETYTPVPAHLLSHDTVAVSFPAEISADRVAYAFIPTVTTERANLYRADGVPPLAFTIPITKSCGGNQ